MVREDSFLQSNCILPEIYAHYYSIRVSRLLNNRMEVDSTKHFIPIFIIKNMEIYWSDKTHPNILLDLIKKERQLHKQCTMQCGTASLSFKIDNIT